MPHLRASLAIGPAWSRYSASLRELEGRDYDDAETQAWAELQRHLRAIDAERVAS